MEKLNIQEIYDFCISNRDGCERKIKENNNTLNLLKLTSSKRAFNEVIEFIERQTVR